MSVHSLGKLVKFKNRGAGIGWFTSDNEGKHRDTIFNLRSRVLSTELRYGKTLICVVPPPHMYLTSHTPISSPDLEIEVEVSKDKCSAILSCFNSMRKYQNPQHKNLSLNLLITSTCNL